MEKLTYKFNQLDEFMELLKQLSKTPVDQFVADKIRIGSAKYYLQVSIECCLDISNHIIAAEKLRAPKDYADTFSVLTEANIVSLELGGKLRQMAKFRNRLVHMYGEIDDTYVHRFITHEINDINAFRKTISEMYLGSEDV